MRVRKLKEWGWKFSRSAQGVGVRGDEKGPDDCGSKRPGEKLGRQRELQLNLAAARFDLAHD